jgi:phage tail sheath protein FI
MAATEYHHGVRVIETTGTGAAIRVVSTAVIGLVATAPDADDEAFPINTPVLLTNPAGGIGKAGKGGTLAKALTAISGQSRALTIVVRVEEGADIAATTSNVIGTVTATGQRTGIQALLAAESELGVKPRIIGAPSWTPRKWPMPWPPLPVPARLHLCGGTRCHRRLCQDQGRGHQLPQGIRPARSHGVVAQLHGLGQHRRRRRHRRSRHPGSPAYALGLRAKLDQEVGWHKNISNAVINGPEGITVPVFFDLQNPASDAGYLNALEVTTIIRRSGYRFWGSRTCEEQGGKFSFENYTRTAQVLADTIAEAHFAFVDKPMHPSLVRDMLGYINSRFRDLVGGGYLIGAEAYFDPDRNSKEDLAAGRLLISYRYTPVPPLENLIFEQSITDDFLAEFAAAIQA